MGNALRMSYGRRQWRILLTHLRPAVVRVSSPQTTGAEKAKIHYTMSPRIASPQQACNKMARQKSVVSLSVVSFPKFHYNDLLPASWQQVGSFSVYGEVTGKRV